ncbi:MAG: TetR/AcrR family transcriptional regulator [Myxococcales bacterium]
MAEIEADDAQGHLRAELRAHKRERILETATRLFYEHGYRATSMESIADELSATKPFIYYHFKNKYDILEAIALRVIRMATESLLRATNQGGSPVEVVSNMVRNYAGLVIEEQRIIAVFWREESNFNEDTRRKILSEQQRFHETLAGVLAQGKTAGTFVLDDLQLTSLAITNLITFTYTWYRRDGVLSSRQLAEHYVSLVLRMLGVS